MSTVSAPEAASPKSVPGGPAGQPIGIAGAFLAMLGWAGSGVLVKALSLGSLVVVSYRFWASTIIFGLYLLIRGRPMTWSKLKIALPGGLGLAGDVVFFFSAIKMTSVANATVIASLQPILMIFLASRTLGEKVSRRQVGFSLVAVVGVIILLFGSGRVPEADVRGDLIAGLALFGWTAYLYYGKATQDRLDPVEYTLGAGFVTAVVATPLMFLVGQDVIVPGVRDLALLATMVVGSGMLAHLLMNWSLHRIPVWVGSSTTLLIPGASAGLAWIFLGERMVWPQAVGMAVTIIALTGIVIENNQRRLA